MTDETQDSKPKNKKLVLPKEARLMMVSFLESQNINDADALDDETVLKRYNESALKMQEKINHYEVSAETKSLNMYLNQNSKMRLTDKEFIARLFRLNMPAYYLHLFKDDDAQLDDRGLWLIANKSGISPVREAAILGKMRRSPIKLKAFQ